MKIKLIRRLLIIRLALSFVFDYWKICRLNRKLQGMQLETEVNHICAQAGKRMRLTAFRLKGIIVKIGQFLSMREDLLPQAFTEQLTELQDAMPAAPFRSVHSIIEQELNQKIQAVFSSFDENAVAAASLAQVHKAVLLNGTKVAVKVLRPGMEKMAQADLDSLGLVAKITQRIPSLSRKMNFVELHQQFTETIHRELDFGQELFHLQRIEDMFSKDQRLKVPKAYQEYCSRRLLVLEYVEGARITDKRTLAAWKVDGLSMAETLLEAYLRQLFLYGFIHVDPHPGNLLILPDHRLCMLDFGMIHELTTNEVKTIRLLLQSFLFHDIDGILSALEQLGYLHPDANREQLRNNFSQIHDCKQLNIAKLKMLLQNSPLKLRAKYMFLLRGTGLLKSSLTLMAPHADLFNLLLKVGPSVFMTPAEDKEDESALT